MTFLRANVDFSEKTLNTLSTVSYFSQTSQNTENRMEAYLQFKIINK